MSLVRSIMLSGQKNTEAYFTIHFNNHAVLNSMKKAVEGKEKEARAELYAGSLRVFGTLKEKVKARDVQFILPDGRVLLRLGTPYVYGDNLFQVNPTIKQAIATGTPQEGFATDGMFSGYVYAYPLRDEEGKNLGVVAFYMSLEGMRSLLKEINPDTPYILLMKESILQKVFPEYREYYIQVKGLKGWMIEDPYKGIPHSVGKLSEEEETILKSLLLEKEFLKALHTEGNHIMFFSNRGKHYKVIVTKIKEGNEEAAALVSLPSGADIHSLSRSYKAYLITSYLLSFVIFLFTLFYTRGIYRLRLSHTQMDTILSLTNTGVVVLDKEGKVVFLNQTACDILGYSKEELLGKSFHNMTHYHVGPAESCPIHKAVSLGHSYQGEDSFMRKDGSLIEVELDVKPIQIYSILEGAIMSFYDISEMKKREKELYTMAVHDKLTGLYNRWYAEDFFEKEFARMNRQSLSISLIMLDVDNFKKINDTYGHNVGDEVLRSLAGIIRKSVRSYDLVVRWGGEEFLVLLPDTDAQEAVSIAERVRSSVEAFSMEGIPKFTVSIGVTSYRVEDTVESFIERADNALYLAKSKGKNCVVVG
ncbi:MAG: diguanylate cyclase [Aquificaceae bacterium]|nr:diguanylate cyclase [Aquificaceae bacterium]